MLGVGARDANPGSNKVTRKTMDIKSNTKGVSEVPTSKSPQQGADKSSIRSGSIGKDGKVSM